MKRKIFAFVLAVCLTAAVVPVAALAAGYVASRDRDVFHRPGCSRMKNIADSDRILFKTVSDAISAGYNGCYMCGPADDYSQSQSTVKTKPDGYYDGYFNGVRDQKKAMADEQEQVKTSMKAEIKKAEDEIAYLKYELELVKSESEQKLNAMRLNLIIVTSIAACLAGVSVYVAISVKRKGHIQEDV